MKLSEIKDNQFVKYRTGRVGITSIAWGDWKTSEMTVLRDKLNKVYLITPKNEDWIIYGPNDLKSPRYGIATWFFLAEEDWYMEIEGLNGV